MRKNPDGTFQLVESVQRSAYRGTVTIFLDPRDGDALYEHLDTSAVIDKLQEAIKALQGMDGRGALAAAADAVARLGMFVS